MLFALNDENSGQYRGDPPFHASVVDLEIRSPHKAGRCGRKSHRWLHFRCRVSSVAEQGLGKTQTPVRFWHMARAFSEAPIGRLLR